VSFIQQVMADPSKAAAFSQSLDFDLSKIPSGTDVFALMAKLPPATLARVSGAIVQKFTALGRSMIVQMAVEPIRA
jgi:ribosomal protein L2